jgi:hypothetical protein
MTPPPSQASAYELAASVGGKYASAPVMHEFAEEKRKIAALHELNEIETFC